MRDLSINVIPIYADNYVYVRQGQQDVGNNDNNCAWYNQDDLPIAAPGDVHFTNPDQILIGQRVAELIINTNLHTNP